MALTDLLPQPSIVTSTVLFWVVVFLLYQTWIFVRPQSSTHRKLVDLPVVNLKGSDYAGAQKEWERNARKHFQDGLDKVKTDLICAHVVSDFCSTMNRAGKSIWTMVS